MNASNLSPFRWPAEPQVQLGQWGCASGLDEDATAFRASLRQFANTVMRPIGRVLDRMDANQVVAENSPLYSFVFRQRPGQPRTFTHGSDDYKRAVHAIHTDANLLMAATFSGVARAAYDHALAYAHERKQGGLPIIRHQDIARRLFYMLRKVEAAQALTQRVARFNNSQPIPALQAAMLSKVIASEHALDVANEAVQMFGGNGLTRDYPVEKIFRDARASLIEDGCNQMLAIKGGYQLINPEWL